VIDKEENICGGGTGIEVTVNTRSSTGVSITWPAGRMAAPFLDLTSHMNVHKSKYKCTECGKSFGSNPVLMRHKLILWRETF